MVFAPERRLEPVEHPMDAFRPFFGAAFRITLGFFATSLREPFVGFPHKRLDQVSPNAIDLVPFKLPDSDVAIGLHIAGDICSLPISVCDYCNASVRAMEEPGIIPKPGGLYCSALNTVMLNERKIRP